jgi:hypothetical protein
MPFFLFFYTQTVHTKSIIHMSFAKSSKKPYILAGFEPWSTVPEADAMSTASHQGYIVLEHVCT